MSLNTLLPWHAKPWQLLWEARQKNRLPHALLFVGACDLEKRHFAESISAALLCANPTAQGGPCNICHPCHLVKAKSHPDLIWVEPEEAGRIIKIDQIRDLVIKMHETSMQSGLRVVILTPAHAMNGAAANALLKTLEEPASNTLMILISDQSLRLPATISSRCQKIVFNKPASDAALTWLNAQPNVSDVELLLHLAQGSPLKALALEVNGMMAMRKEIYQGLHALTSVRADPLQFAVKCQEYDMLELLKLVQLWLRDLLRFKLTDGEAKLINSDYRAHFAEMSGWISQENTVKYIDLIQRAYHNILHRLNLNKQLLLEECWITWTRYVSR